LIIWPTAVRSEVDDEDDELPHCPVRKAPKQKSPDAANPGGLERKC